MGKVYIAGAGPGHPDYLSVRVARLLETCDFVLYDRLVDATVLWQCRSDCEKIYVGKTPGHHTMKQDAINKLLIAKARLGRVLRLKGGDPFVFGRGTEECMALRRAGIDYEVIPGMTSAVSVPGAVGIPLTHRLESRMFTVVTGHTADGTDPDYETLSKIKGTIVFLMGLRDLDTLCARLIEKGMDPDMPAALISNGTLGNEHVVRTTLKAAPAVAGQDASVVSPTILVVGATTLQDLRSPVKHPLDNQVISVCGTLDFCSKVAEQARDRGARVDVHPIVKIQPYPNDWIQRFPIETYRYLVFTGKNAVRGFFDAYQKDIRQLARVKIVAIGPATARYLHSFHVYEDAMPSTYTSQGLADYLITHCTSRDKVFIPRAKKGNEVLAMELSRHGIAFDEAAIYDTVIEPPKAIQGNYVVFGSAQGVHGFFTKGGVIPPECTIVCIGPYSEEACRFYSTNAVITPMRSCVEGIIARICDEVKKNEK